MMGEAITQFLWRLLLDVRTYVKRIRISTELRVLSTEYGTSVRGNSKAHGAERKAKEDYRLLTTGQRTLERQLAVGSEQQENGLQTTDNRTTARGKDWGQAWIT